MLKAVPINIPSLSGNELKYLTECIQSGWISSEGPFVEKFEQEFSAYVDRKHGVAVSNGSAALDIAVQALDIGPGDEVIVPAFTIISPAQSVVRAGAKLILVDSDPETWNMDVSQIEAKITSATKAIIVVHIYGLPADMDPIIKIAKKYNLKIIEDAAQMHGQTYKGKKCGSFGDISTFSFYPNKLITTGEGGMILTDNPELEKRCRSLRNITFGTNENRFVHDELGWNYRITNLQSALGLAQLEQIDKFIDRKREVGKYYLQNLGGLKNRNYQLPLPKTNYADNIYWVFALVAPDKKEKERMINHLHNQMVATRPFFWCMHEQPVFKKMGLFKGENYPVAEKLARNGFYIPSGLGLTNEDLKTVVKSITECPA